MLGAYMNPMSVRMRTRFARALRRATPTGLVRVIDNLARFFDRNALKSYAQEGEDLVLLRIFDGYSSGFYVDIGAHHPQRFSNTWLFYQLGWTGINVEPNPAVIDLFRRERPRDINLQVGVSDEPGTLTYIEFDDPALNTFDSELGALRERTTQYHVVNRIGVPVRTLCELLETHLPAGQCIDFLTVDVEGYDFRVIQSNDWTRFRPAYVLVESLESSLALVDKLPINTFLASQGYVLYAKTVNTLFYRKETQKP